MGKTEELQWFKSAGGKETEEKRDMGLDRRGLNIKSVLHPWLLPDRCVFEGGVTVGAG